jgi:hypothetical protein
MTIQEQIAEVKRLFALTCSFYEGELQKLRAKIPDEYWKCIIPCSIDVIRCYYDGDYREGTIQFKVGDVVLVKENLNNFKTFEIDIADVYHEFTINYDDRCWEKVEKCDTVNDSFFERCEL